METAEEIAGGLFVAGRDAAELFDKVEEAFDEIALGVKREIATAFDLAVRFWRDDRLDGADLEGFDEAVGVVAFVTKEGLGLDLGG